MGFVGLVTTLGRHRMRTCATTASITGRRTIIPRLRATATLLISAQVEQHRRRGNHALHQVCDLTVESGRRGAVPYPGRHLSSRRVYSLVEQQTPSTVLQIRPFRLRPSCGFAAAVSGACRDSGCMRTAAGAGSPFGEIEELRCGLEMLPPAL